jgi:hypothetical protein
VSGKKCMVIQCCEENQEEERKDEKMEKENNKMEEQLHLYQKAKEFVLYCRKEMCKFLQHATGMNIMPFLGIGTGMVMNQCLILENNDFEKCLIFTSILQCIDFNLLGIFWRDSTINIFCNQDRGIINL